MCVVEQFGHSFVVYVCVREAWKVALSIVKSNHSYVGWLRDRQRLEAWGKSQLSSLTRENSHCNAANAECSVKCMIEILQHASLSVTMSVRKEDSEFRNSFE